MSTTILGLDLGGTHLRGGWVSEERVSHITSRRIDARQPADAVLQQVFAFTDPLVSSEIEAIGIGVPGLVVEGIVYDVINIPSWKLVPLQKLMEERYAVPVVINNDANCFALGEFYFGKGKGHESMIGLTIGTGLGSGIIINKKLYTGKSCGAGEFGMIEYRDQFIEYYASGQFFKNVYGIDGELVFHRAVDGDPEALKMYEEMGMHLGNAIKTILYALDVDLIILGGSVRHAFSFFEKTMWQQIQSFAFSRAKEQLRIEVSELQNSGILGAAALYYDRIAQ